MQRKRLLVVGNGIDDRGILINCLTHPYTEILEAPDKKTALNLLRNHKFSLVIVTYSHSEKLDDIQLAQVIRQREKEVPLILITRHSSEEKAIAALRAGVQDYFRIPFDCAEFGSRIFDLLSEGRASWCRHSKPMSGASEGRCQIVGQDAAMSDMKDFLKKVARTDSTVLITGETGTGKELVAETIHENSPRRGKPLVCINCAALPDGLAESELFGHERGAFTGAYANSIGKLKQADGGTVFFDEIGDMSSSAQAKVLRVIESREVHRVGGREGIPLDVRFIAATNKDLESLADNGSFRRDLYFRLNVIRIHLPPLRNRKDDIPLLIDHFARESGECPAVRFAGFSPSAMEFLLCYDWPGNIRELKNLIEFVFVDPGSRKISVQDLPASMRGRNKSHPRAADSERDRLIAALTATRWNKSKAAQTLDWSRVTLYRKMAKYHVTRPSSGTAP